jgi:hypothetical protein
VTNEEQLQWEARFGRPAALAAFAAGLLLLAGTFVLQSVPEDRNGVEARADFLLSVAETSTGFWAATLLHVTAVLCLIPVFYLLFRATIHRVPLIPRWFVYVIVLGPVLYAVAQVLSALTQVDVAETFASGDYSFENPDDEDLERCPADRGDLGTDCAGELLREETNPGLLGLSLAGNVAVAFLFVMLPLRARRAGLLSPFMSILGVIAGVLFVLPLLPGVPIFLQAFWLGAVGALFLGNWPGGRGPAWDSGEPDPWPTAAERRGLATPRDDAAAEGAANGGGPSAPAEPEPVPDRPSTRKRKRKRR